jgi:tRNA U38,U39,U40 pseudouridine synthase TruA
MPYNPIKNKWEDTTSKLNKERMWRVKNPNKLTDQELLEDAYKELRGTKNVRSFKETIRSRDSNRNG